jgi:hypothetical protein
MKLSWFLLLDERLEYLSLKKVKVRTKNESSD